MQQPAPLPQGSYQVYLNIYDVAPPAGSLASNPDDKGMSSLVVKLNNFGRDLGLGGVFHGAVQIDNWEWSYGFCEHGTGVYVVEARRNPMYQFRETIDLGYSPKTKQQIKDILHRMKQQWQGPAYELLSHNCCHFCEAFTAELEVKPIPTWVNRLATSADATVTFTNHAVAVAQTIGYSVTRTANSGYSWLRESVAKLLTPGPQDPQQQQQQQPAVMVGSSLSYSGGAGDMGAEGRPRGRAHRVLNATTARLHRPGGSASHDGSPLRTGSHNLSDSLAFAAAATAGQVTYSNPGSALNVRSSHHTQTSVWGHKNSGNPPISTVTPQAAGGSGENCSHLAGAGQEGDAQAATSGLASPASASGGMFTARRRAHPFASLRLGSSSNSGTGGVLPSGSGSGSAPASATQASKADSMTATSSCFPGVGPLFRGGLRDEGSILHDMGLRSASYSGTSQRQYPDDHHHHQHRHSHHQQHRLAGAAHALPTAAPTGAAGQAVLPQPRGSIGGHSVASADHAVLSTYVGPQAPAPFIGHHSVPSSPLIQSNNSSSSPAGGVPAGKQRGVRSNSARMQTLLGKLSDTLKSAAPSRQRGSSVSGNAAAPGVGALAGLHSGPPSLSGHSHSQVMVASSTTAAVCAVVGPTSETGMLPVSTAAQHLGGMNEASLITGDRQQQQEPLPSFLLERMPGSGLPSAEDSEGPGSDLPLSSHHTPAPLEPRGLAQPRPSPRSNNIKAPGDSGHVPGGQHVMDGRSTPDAQPLSTRQDCMDLTVVAGFSNTTTTTTASVSQPTSARAAALRLRNPFEDDDDGDEEQGDDEVARAFGQLMMTGTVTSTVATTTGDGSPQPNIARTAFLPPEWMSDWGGASGSGEPGVNMRPTAVFSRAGLMLSSSQLMGAGDGGSMPLLSTAGDRQMGAGAGHEPLAELSGLSALLDDGRRSSSLPVNPTGLLEKDSCDVGQDVQAQVV